jgi:DNA-binding Lrp family transcriptional regulator
LARTKSVQSFKDESLDLEARIISAIGSAGPRNVAEISRLTGAHQETIRYKIKKRFGRLGFKFHAEVDYHKLGLTLHWSSLGFSKAHYGMAPQILTALNQVGYLVYYGKLIPQGNFYALFALPEDTADQYREFLSGLVDEKVLANFTFEESLVSRHKPMGPRFFNFRSGRWEIEWEKVPNLASVPLPFDTKSGAENFDRYDLLIIKELQIDSLQHMTGIARKLKVHQKTLEYHYRTHVQKWKLVPSYRIRWAQDISKRLVHSTASTWLTFPRLTKGELVEVQAAINRIPFLWSEDLLRDGTYMAFLYTPLTDLLAVSSYINNSIPHLASKLELSFVKPAEAQFFTIPYNMYQGDRWKFDVHQMNKALRKESVVPLQK